MKKIALYKKVNNKSKGKVFVGLSGGVDSAVSAAILKEQGFDVTGVFIKAWTPDWMPCTWKEDRRSAMRAAAKLDLPFITLDLEKVYKQEVVDYMISEYKKGRTPNPDVMCNKEIKFGKFLKFALENGADFVATGHYAVCTRLDGDIYELREGKDKNKDQSYFLWTLTQAELKHTLFPVGNIEKPQVRKLAHKFGLPQETRKDSQGLCFLGKIDMKEFLSHYVPPKKGDVLNTKGEKIGSHNGAIFFTLGERHGFTITEKGSSDSVYYVVSKDISKNNLTVDFKISKNTKKDKIKKDTSWQLREVNWIFGQIPKDGKVECRFRYRQKRISCKVEEVKGTVTVRFLNEPEVASPGQSVVFYSGEKCLGGGIIA